MRDYIGDREDRFFASVFLGSSRLLLAMLLAAAALAAGLVSSGEQGDGSALLSQRDVGRRATRHEHADRRSDVFSGCLHVVDVDDPHACRKPPRWLAVSGYAVAIVLLIVVGTVPWVEVLFPLWVMLVSLHILRAVTRGRRAWAPARSDRVDHERPRMRRDDGAQVPP